MKIYVATLDNMKTSNSLYVYFGNIVHTEFANVEQFAQTQEKIRFGTPGTLEDRVRGSSLFTYHRYYDAAGKLVEDLVAKQLDTPQGISDREKAQDRIDRANERVKAVKKLRSLGFACADDATGATLAALHNHGLFEAGLTLVGSHSYGAILNHLGVRAQTYLTEDVDTSSLLRLSIGQNLNLLDVLKTTGLPFVKSKIGLSPKSKSETYLVSNKSNFMFDVLVDGHDIGEPVFVPEINAYAQTIPYLKYLVEGRVSSAIISKTYIVPVFIPDPRRFAIHKLFSSVSRINMPAKSEKDILQAATVICAVEDKYPGDITDEMKEFPLAGRSQLLKGAASALPVISAHSEQYGDAIQDAINEMSRPRPRPR